MSWAGHVAWIWENKIAPRILVGKSEGKRAVGRRKHGWKNNDKIDLSEIDMGCCGPDRVQWRALVNTVVKLRAP
jgi:hypothetical protein